MAFSRSPLLASALIAVCLLYIVPSAFVTPSQQQLRGAAVGTVAAVGALAPAFPALAGEPPSVGAHWYWDLGIGTLHGETASIILMVFGLLVIFSLLGAGGSSRKTA
eukprot:TRINITY_DN1191_c0_g1_i2.p1 TRINITY_DN1191_c0_g1~~TRINITY_DN1191_c0_g1_i2.p1  ORF type:complete len:107 (+),score=25.31 TRINITY_DN1191_c0_g1_i2:86-406(+)